MFRELFWFGFFCFILWAFSGCGSTMGMMPYRSMPSAAMHYQMQQYPRYGMPASIFGGCIGESDDSPRCVKFVNNTNYHARCWLGYDNYRPATPGPERQWVTVLSFLPHQWDRLAMDSIHGRIRCEFYAGPPPLILYAVGESPFNGRHLTDHEYPLSYINPKPVM